MRRIWIDTDTASDDAVALMIAITHAEESIVGISTVAGNVPVAQASINASFTVRLCGADLPIFEGASSPLTRPLETAQYVHGQDGMGDIGLDLGAARVEAQHGVDALLDASERFARDLEVVTLGPLTNLALTLRLDPSFATRVSRVVIMGGASDCYGNVTPVSEYNLWADPEAADVVFRSALPKQMVGWDISRKYASFSPRDAEALRGLATERARVAVDSQHNLREFCANTSGVAGFDLPDPIAMAVALRPEIVLESQAYAVSVCCHEGPTRGMAILSDRHAGDTPKTTDVATKADRELFVTMLREALTA